jgi:Acyl-CoA dehydrogenase, C-terminal domain
VFDPDYVVNGDIADIVIAAGTQENPGKLTRWTTFSTEPVATMDPTRRLARVTPQSIAPVGTDPGVADIAAILLAAEQIGAAARCLELTIEYTKERVQFGRPIGSFQALKHRMADLHVMVQAARAVVYEAVEQASEQAARKPSATSAALARIAATEAFSTVAAESIQLHGGIAITWEHDMQLYFKRAHGSSQLLGSARTHLRRLESEVF